MLGIETEDSAVVDIGSCWGLYGCCKLVVVVEAVFGWCIVGYGIDCFVQDCDCDFVRATGKAKRPETSTTWVGRSYGEESAAAGNSPGYHSWSSINAVVGELQRYLYRKEEINVYGGNGNH